jgi:hypothetical protein
LITTTTERSSDEVPIETIIRKQLALKAHRMTEVEEAGEQLIIHVDRLGTRLLRCGYVGSGAGACIAFPRSGKGGTYRCARRR